MNSQWVIGCWQLRGHTLRGKGFELVSTRQHIYYWTCYFIPAHMKIPWSVLLNCFFFYLCFINWKKWNSVRKENWLELAFLGQSRAGVWLQEFWLQGPAVGTPLPLLPRRRHGVRTAFREWQIISVCLCAGANFRLSLCSPVLEWLGWNPGALKSPGTISNFWTLVFKVMLLMNTVTRWGYRTICFSAQ